MEVVEKCPLCEGKIVVYDKENPGIELIITKL